LIYGVTKNYLLTSILKTCIIVFIFWLATKLIKNHELLKACYLKLYYAIYHCKVLQPHYIE